MVLGESLVLSLARLAIGLPLAALGARLLRSLLFTRRSALIFGYAARYCPGDGDCERHSCAP